MGDEHLPTPTPTRALVVEDEADEIVRAVFRSVAQHPVGEPAEVVRIVSIFGDVKLDYRDAELPLGTTTIQAHVVMGSAKVIVPPDVDVEVTGSVVLGSVDTVRDARRSRRPERPIGGSGAEFEDERPLLHIACSGAMGSVDIEFP